MDTLNRQLHVRWQHVGEADDTCERCTTTGTSLETALAQLRTALGKEGIDVTFDEASLPCCDVEGSNLIEFNGRPIEDLVPGMQVIRTSCASCGCSDCGPVDCRALTLEGQTFEAIPPEMILDAARAALDQPA